MKFLRVLRHQAGLVQSDISYLDAQGKLQVDTDMLTNLQKVLFPVLADALKYVPVPRIHSSNSEREFWLDKIVLCSYDIIPENIRFHLETDSEFSFKDIETKATHSFLVIQLQHLRTELNGMDFFYSKKTFPTLEDSGRVSFRIKGDGAKLTLNYTVEQKHEDKIPRILKGHADFEISDMDIEFDQTTIKHSVLIPMLIGIFKRQIKLQIEREVERNLQSWIDKLGELISNTILQADRCPFLAGFKSAKEALKQTELSQIYLKRREKLEWF